jgi:hypothetical protein
MTFRFNPRVTMKNARRMATREFKRKPNWALAMELFGLGSTSAREFCGLYGIAPDATDIEPLPFGVSYTDEVRENVRELQERTLEESLRLARAL